jgi:Asp-tRNA(Asn)/Glu-tRNA(Gln) amidotransferase A subunit family amidase
MSIDSPDTTYDRRAFMSYFGALGLSSTLLPGVLWAQANQQQGSPITKEMVAAAEQIAGLEFTEEERTAIANGLANTRTTIQRLHQNPLPYNTFPSYVFDPVPPGEKMPALAKTPMVRAKVPVMARPTSVEELAYAGVAQLSELVRTRKVKPSELTEMYIGRLKKYDPQLHCVITLTEERARAQAKQLDSEISLGKYRGPLHGIPWGGKDLLAVKGYPTTWGAGLYKEQSFDHDATVVKRLDDAGAILIAKLTLGALAQGDVWFGERTRNPWNPGNASNAFDGSTGSSGSSAGTASAVSAGCVPFGLGTETNGSITSPSTVCAISGFRPTFGRVPRTGAMALAYTMDKIGPMTRSAEDCAIVFSVIQGPDNIDRATKDVPFSWNAASPLARLRIAYIDPPMQRTSATDSTMIKPPVNPGVLAAVEALKAQGATVKMIPALPTANQYAGIILDAECGAAFQPDTVNGRIRELDTPREFLTTATERANGTTSTRAYSTWGGTFRRGQFVPAVEYINAMRARTKLQQDYWNAFKDVDVVIMAGAGGPVAQGTNENTSVTNLTGNPCITAPAALYTPQVQQGGRGAGAGAPANPNASPPAPLNPRPGTIRFLGALYRDDLVTRVAHAYQSATDFHKAKPPQFP